MRPEAVLHHKRAETWSKLQNPARFWGNRDQWQVVMRRGSALILRTQRQGLQGALEVCHVESKEVYAAVQA